MNFYLKASRSTANRTDSCVEGKPSITSATYFVALLLAEHFCYVIVIMGVVIVRITATTSGAFLFALRLAFAILVAAFFTNAFSF